MCGSAEDADWALALCATTARVIMMAIADLLRSFRADIRPTLHAMKSPSCIGFPFGVVAQFRRSIPPAAKAATDYAAFTARLKSCPFPNLPEPGSSRAPRRGGAPSPHGHFFRKL